MKGIKSIISSTKEIISQYPFNTQVGISTAKSSASDFFVQKQVEKKPLKCIDWRRADRAIVNFHLSTNREGI